MTDQPLTKDGEDFDDWLLRSYKTSRRKAVKLAIDMLLGRNTLHDRWERGTPAKIERPDDWAQQRDAWERSRLGDALDLIEGGQLVQAEADRDIEREFPNWSFFCTLFDPIDRGEGAPPRIHINTPWRHIIIALGPHGRLGRHSDSRSKESRLGGYLNLGRYHNQICYKVVALERTIDHHILTHRVCTLDAGHSGPCWDWKDKEEVWFPTIQFVGG